MAEDPTRGEGGTSVAPLNVEPVNRGGRPSNETKFAALESRLDEMAARMDMLEDELTAKVTEARQQAQEAAKAANVVEQTPNVYCELCGALDPYHYETVDGTNLIPCPNAPGAAVPTTSVAETAAA